MTRHKHVRGVSLLEALVAMAVMAVGAVAVVGLQSTLRSNGDLAKQRSEATRLAQARIEEWRGFAGLTATAGVVDWTDVTSVNEPGLVGSSAVFTRSSTVVESGAADDAPLSKTLHVRMTWQDRTGVDQSVELNTTMAGVHPELAGTLSISHAKSPLRSPSNRHPDVPRSAVDQGDGSSRFSPPGAGTEVWVFNNTTGLVVKLCSDSATCSDVRGMLLAGFVRFSTGLTQPSASDAESPVSSPVSLAVSLNQTSPYSTSVNCFEEFGATAVAYFCLVRVNLVTTTWSGRAELSGLSVAPSIAGALSSQFKVCRYTTVRSNTAVVPTDMTNVQHPLDYVSVDRSLTNQNYLLIRAGDGSLAYQCPDDNTATPNLNTATWFHQPSS